MDMSIHGVVGVRLGEVRSHNDNRGGMFYVRDILLSIKTGYRVETFSIGMFSNCADGLFTPEEVEATRTLDARAAMDSLLEREHEKHLQHEFGEESGTA